MSFSFSSSQAHKQGSTPVCFFNYPPIALSPHMEVKLRNKWKSSGYVDLFTFLVRHSFTASPTFQEQTNMARGKTVSVPRCLDAESHDRVDDIVVVLLECLDSLLPRYVGLGHDEFDVLVLNALGVHFLAVVLLFLGSLVGGGVGALNGLPAGLTVVVARVVVLGGGQLLGSGGLGGGVQVLDLGLTEDAVARLVSPAARRCLSVEAVAYM